jgi:hypothetical protein
VKITVSDPVTPTSDEPIARLDSRDDRIVRVLELLAQRESQPPRRARDVYPTVIASLVGILALGISGYTAYVQRAQLDAQRVQLSAQVRPHLRVGSSEVEPKVALLMINRGTGPARIDRARVVVDGRPVKSWLAAAKAVGLTGNDLMWSSLTGVWVSSGQEQMIFAPDSEQSRAVFAQWFHSGKHTLAVTVCYCSVLEDCWVTGWRDDGHYSNERETCPIDDAQRFGD